ncbi:glycosyltransferase [Adlercreutzia sp. ZJ138]|uniref:glycosyltransferase n=1 Tax=Adlercreutzia sp. ZJ138 TaxID=2709405 RepID=UPI0013ECBCE4|nr:glycosyltransferase [Adlercreutzia sp. ZJ138]
MRILYVTTIGATMVFFEKLIRELIAEGHTVDIANGDSGAPVPSCYGEWGCHVYHLSCSRSPLSWGNVKAVRQIRRLAEGQAYDIVHCHTPVAAACTRLACRKLRGNGLRVFYTAHGFHFYKGSPILNWLVYYPIERLCSRWTDTLVTINQEDYGRAQRFKTESVVLVLGVGLDREKFHEGLLGEEERSLKRGLMGLAPDDVLILSVGEVNANKNHKLVIDALVNLKDERFRYFVAGEGPLLGDLRRYSESLGLGHRVSFLGRREDVAELYSIADYYVHPSFREGLPVSLMEAVSSGTYALASDIRGCRDILPGVRLFSPRSPDSLVDLIRAGEASSRKNDLKLDEKFYLESVISVMRTIYATSG